MQRSCSRFSHAAGSPGKPRLPVASPSKVDRRLHGATVLSSPSRIVRQLIQLNAAAASTSVTEQEQLVHEQDLQPNMPPPAAEGSPDKALDAQFHVVSVDASSEPNASSGPNVSPKSDLPAEAQVPSGTNGTVEANSSVQVNEFAEIASMDVGGAIASAASSSAANSPAKPAAPTAEPLQAGMPIATASNDSLTVSELEFQPPEETVLGSFMDVLGGPNGSGSDAGEKEWEGGKKDGMQAAASAVTQIMGNDALRSAFLTADASLNMESQNTLMSALSGVQRSSQDPAVTETVELQAAGPSGLFRGSFLANLDDVQRNAPALLTPAFSAALQQPGAYFVHATTSDVLKELLRFIRMKGKQAGQWQPASEDPQVLRELRQVAMELQMDSLVEWIQAAGDRASGKAAVAAAPALSLTNPTTNTFVKELIVSGRHLRFQTRLEECVEQGAPSVCTLPGPCWVDLPAPPLIGVTRRNRFEVVEGSLQLMHRAISSTMHDFIFTHNPSPVPVTIIGPPGFGKSHSLLEVVCRLKAEPENRVVYIPDCQGWACEAGNGPFEYLLEAVVSAFPRDQEVLEHCLACDMKEDSISKLLKWLPEYCGANELKLYAVFDGHSGLTTEQRQSVFPLNIAENLLAVSAEWKTCSVVICGSASYNYKLIGNQDGSWPLFDFCQGLNDEEFEAWIRFKRLPVPNRYKGRVKFETSSIPLELYFLRQAYYETSPDIRSIPTALQAYRVLRAEALTEQQYTFSRECLWKLIDEDGAIAAISAMHLKLGLRGASQALEPNLSLMYKAWIKVEQDGSQVVVRAAPEATYRGLLPITPLAAQVLTSYWGQRAAEHQLATIQEVFSSDMYDAREKGMALQRHFEANLRARMHLELIGFQVVSNTPQEHWPEVVFSLDDIRLVTLEYGEAVPLCTVDWDRATIFRPACRMSAGPDYVLWNPERHELLALRVTTLPLHMKIGKWRDFTDTPVPQGEGEELMPAYEQWEIRLAEDLGRGNFRIRAGWLTTNLQASAEFDSHYVFPHHLLDHRQFPLMDMLPSRGYK